MNVSVLKIANRPADGINGATSAQPMTMCDIFDELQACCLLMCPLRLLYVVGDERKCLRNGKDSVGRGKGGKGAQISSVSRTPPRDNNTTALLSSDELR